MDPIKFEVGKTYYTRSLGDYNCIISVEILKRTAKTVTAKVDGRDVKTFRPFIGHYRNAEMIRPWGNYSMSPLVDATDTKQLERI